MKKPSLLIALLIMIAGLAACSLGATPEPTALPTFTPPPSPTATATATLTPTPTPTVVYPAEGMGPSGFPTDVNPLTGLKVEDPALLERRPMAIKVSNLPRNVRPQFGLSLADMVYEYYTEQGSTRFVALFLGRDAETVGSIRSARLFDANIVRMYRAILAFGSGDVRVRDRLYNSEYASRLVSEFPAGCPPMCRYEPNGVNYLVTNTAELSKYVTESGVPNGRQNLDGMFFKREPPEGGTASGSAFVHYSGGIYNRWDYDPATGKYARFSETTDNLSGPENDTYAPLTDRLTNEPITADNVLVVLMPHEYYSVNPEIIDVPFGPSGTAYLFRDGQVYKVLWQRPSAESVLYLTLEDGTTPFPFKPGNTWVEVMGSSSKVAQEGQDWRFTFQIP
jgi:hypothetical protein